MSLNWRAIPSLSALRAFDATARNGDFASAAQALNVTHAAVAQQVRALERLLCVSLAVRDGRSVRLTPIGEELARSLATGFEEISGGIERIRAREARRGIRVTATPFLVDRIIMPHLSEFWSLHPGAEISLHPTRECIDLVAEGFDLGIRAIAHDAKVSYPGLEIEPIATLPLIGIAAPQLVSEASFDPQAMPWLKHEGMTTKLKMMRDGGLDVERLRFVPIGSANLLLEAVRKGMGATLFSEHFTREDIASGRLVEVPLPRKLQARYLAVTPSGPRHRLVPAFIEWVRSLF